MTDLTDKPKDDEAEAQQTGDAGGEDTEGHSMLVDPSAARALARSRAAEVDRDARDRQRRKEARPNRG